MHAMVITFRTAVHPSEQMEALKAFAGALRDGSAPGLLSKTWLVDGLTIGGSYVFEDRASADRYLETMFAPAVMSDPNVSDIRIEHFDVIKELSAMTNGLGPVAVGTAG